MTAVNHPASPAPPKESGAAGPLADCGTAYDAVFWLTFLANSSLMVAVAVLFRYADFVTQAGGSDFHLGLIVGIGTLGALAMRIFQGVGIDRFGPRRVWLLSLSLFVASMLGHLAIDSVHGPAVYLMRILMMTSLAGAFGASITFVSLRAPQHRMAEMIGMLGTSGFVGIALGPTLADWIFGSGEVTRIHVNRMFILAAVSSGVSLISAAFATRGHIRIPRRKRPPLCRIIRRYHPGVLLLVAAAMGMGVGMPGTFLRPYAQSLGITGIKTYFLVYAASAFAVRVLTRRFPDRFGVRPTILTGLGCLAASMVCYLLVGPEWSLAIPAVVAGAAHALLFPSVMSGGARTFPARYRGLATTLMLALFDFGNLVGQPAMGGVLRIARHLGIPAYSAMFLCVAAGLVVVGLAYKTFSRSKEKADTQSLVVASSASLPQEPFVERVEVGK